MKNIFAVIATMFVAAMFTTSFAQSSPGVMPATINNYPWKGTDLMAPATLAAVINSNTAGKPVIFNIGAVEDIKGATHIGPVSDAANLKQLYRQVAAYPKDRELVIYCGCCPFPKCPNVRPAFSGLQKLGYTNVKLLDLPKNLKTDWADKGYPLAASK